MHDLASYARRQLEEADARLAAGVPGPCDSTPTVDGFISGFVFGVALCALVAMWWTHDRGIAIPAQAIDPGPLTGEAPGFYITVRCASK